MTAASECPPRAASAAQTARKGKCTAPIVSDTNTTKARSKNIAAETMITLRGVAETVISGFQIQDS
jgi:hypothetical protein